MAEDRTKENNAEESEEVDGDDDEVDMDGAPDDANDDDDDEDDDDEDDDDSSSPSTKRRKRDEDDDDDDMLDDDVEEDLDKILKDRLVVDENEEDEPVPKGERGEQLQPKQQNEQLCSSCFLLVKSSAPNCPVGDDDCPIFS